jgi:hypothetical protein
MTRDEIVAEARGWIGTPFRPNGRSRLGLDCLGLVVMLGRKFGIPHTDAADYSMWPSEERLILRQLGEYLDRVHPQARQDGCIGAFAQQRLPCHVGVLSTRYGRPHVIHTRIAPPVVLEQLLEPQADLRLIAAFSLPGMVD